MAATVPVNGFPDAVVARHTSALDLQDIDSPRSDHEEVDLSHPLPCMLGQAKAVQCVVPVRALGAPQSGEQALFRLTLGCIADLVGDHTHGDHPAPKRE